MACHGGTGVGAFKNVPKEKIISVCAWGIAALISVAVFCFLQIKTDAKSSEPVVSKDKIDSTVLPEPRGENPFVGKIISSPERTMSYVFDSADSMTMNYLLPLDSKFNVPVSFRVSYSVDSVEEKIYAKPVGLIHEDSLIQSSSEITSLLSERILDEILYRYPLIQDCENFPDVKNLLETRAGKIVWGNLFEIFAVEFSLMEKGIFAEELHPEHELIRNGGLRFVSNDDSKIFRITPTSFYFVFDDGKESHSYGGIPDFTESHLENGTHAECSLFLFDSELAAGRAEISDAGKIESEIFFDEKTRSPQSVDVVMEITGVPESFCLSAGERFTTRINSAELLWWFRMEDGSVTAFSGTEKEE